MSSNICGNCENFRPGAGDKFFNCTSAEHAGLKYVMQVRPDTQACDAFAPFKASSAPPPAAEQKSRPETRREVTGLCPWVKIVLLVALVLLIVLLSWLLYSCAISGPSGPAPTPTPVITSSPPPGPLPTPTIPGPPATATPVPTPTPWAGQDISVGEWAATSLEAVAVSTAQRSNTRPAHKGTTSAPPGTDFVIVQVSITNLTNAAMTVQSLDFLLLDSGGRQYLRTLVHGIGGLRNPSSLLSGRTISDYIIYTVPEFASDFKVYYYLHGGVWARWALGF